VVNFSVIEVVNFSMDKHKAAVIEECAQVVGSDQAIQFGRERKIVIMRGTNGSSTQSVMVQAEKVSAF
jgi:hypothetical protein